MTLFIRRSTHIFMLLALLVAGVFVSSAGAATSQVTVIEDPRRIFSSDPSLQVAAMDEVQALGAGIVKIGIPWRSVAPDPESTTKPSIDLADPNAYPAGSWAIVDNAIQLANARGLRVWILITVPAPRWAVKKDSLPYLGSYRPDPAALGDFAEAVGRRYAAVDMFSIWNEVNLNRYIQPQRSGSKIESAVHYRKMYREAYAGLVASGHSSDTILFGEMLPRTGTPKSPTAVPPLAFLRAFFCIDSKGRKLTGSAARKQECSNFKTIRATGLAYHPYFNAAGPLFKEPYAENAPLTYMRRVERLLDQAYKAKRIKARNMKIYNSEFGVQTNPPDKYQVPLSKAPGYLNLSEYLTWVDKRIATYSQYLIIDDVDLTAFQSGLRFENGDKKPGIYEAFQTPIVVFKTSSSGKAYVWGALRAKGPGTAVAEIQVKSGSTWSPVATVPVTSSRGYFSTNVSVPNAKSQTFRVSWAGGVSRETKPVTKVSPRS